MGISMSDLKDHSAFSVVGAFIVTRSSFEYVFATNEEDRNRCITKMIIGACLFEMGSVRNLISD
jgi:hypothetical protein